MTTSTEYNARVVATTKRIDALKAEHLRAGDHLAKIERELELEIRNLSHNQDQAKLALAHEQELADSRAVNDDEPAQP